MTTLTVTDRPRRLPAPDPRPDGSPGSYAPDLAAAQGQYYAAVVRLPALDVVTTEVVRLRCARTHDCRVCQSVRVGAALDAGFDEPMAAKIDDFERSDLPEHQKAALRFTDAFITRPTAIGADLRAQLRAHFTPAQIVELMLDITRWSTQKLPVALGLDAGPYPGRRSLIDFDAQGKVIWGPPLDQD